MGCHTFGTFLFFLSGTLCVCLSTLNAIFLLFLFPPLLYCSPFDFSLSFVPLILSLSHPACTLLCFLHLLFYFPILFIYPPRYHSLLDRAEERRRRLLQCYNEFLLAYEAGDMLDWIREKRAENTGVEPDDVWELQKKFDEFQTVRKRNLPPPPDFFEGYHCFLLSHISS